MSIKKSHAPSGIKPTGVSHMRQPPLVLETEKDFAVALASVAGPNGTWIKGKELFLLLKEIHDGFEASSSNHALIRPRSG